MKLGQCFHAFFLSVVYTNVGPWRVNNKWEKKKKGKARIASIAISKVWGLYKADSTRRSSVMTLLEMSAISIPHVL